MAILGLLILLAAGGLAVDVVAQNTASIDVDAVGTSVSLSPGWLFVAGIATGAVALAGVGLLVVGANRARRQRADMVESRKSVESLQAERDRLAVELERERTRRTATTEEGGDHPRAEAARQEPVLVDVSDERRSSEPVAERDSLRRR